MFHIMLFSFHISGNEGDPGRAQAGTLIACFAIKLHIYMFLTCSECIDFKEHDQQSCPRI